MKMLSTIWLSVMLAGVAHAGESRMDGGRFGPVTVYEPQAQPTSVALFVSGDGGWNSGVIDMARALTDMHAIVVGVDIRPYMRSLEDSSTSCTSMAVDFENLSHEVQKRLRLQTYHVPILVGYSSGATLVYATLTQAPTGTFGGALSMGFCPDLQLAAPPCRGAGLSYTVARKDTYVLDAATHLTQPWLAFQGQEALVCSAKTVDEFAGRIPAAEVVKLPLVGHGFSVERNWLEPFRSTYQKLADRVDAPRIASAGVDDLPLTEVPVKGHGETMALLLTGDGGWAGLDRQLAAKLANKGVPVVGLSALSYFWHEQSPEQTAKDVARALRHYLGEWGRSRVLLIGYSFGADVLPFIVNRLPEDLRARVESVNLLGPARHATFEIHVPGWLGGRSEPGVAIAPELLRMQHDRVLCIYGEGEKDSLCPALSVEGVTVAKIGSGHHFSNDADGLADRILAYAKKTAG